MAEQKFTIGVFIVVYEAFSLLLDGLVDVMNFHGACSELCWNDVAPAPFFFDKQNERLNSFLFFDKHSSFSTGSIDPDSTQKSPSILSTHEQTKKIRSFYHSKPASTCSSLLNVTRATTPSLDFPAQFPRQEDAEDWE